MFSARGQRDKGKGKKEGREKEKLKLGRVERERKSWGKRKGERERQDKRGKKRFGKNRFKQSDIYTLHRKKKRERNVETSQEQRDKNTPVNGYTGKWIQKYFKKTKQIEQKIDR